VPRYFTLLIFLFVSACSNHTPAQWSPIPATDLGVIVAKVGGIPIYAKQVLAVAKMKEISNREALLNVIDSHLLARLATNSASDLVADKDILVQRLIDRDFEPTHAKAAIPEKELKDLYDRAIEVYVRPRLVDIAVLTVYANDRMQADLRETRIQTARELQEHLKKRPPKSLAEFSAIAADPQWKEKKIVFQRFLQGPDKPLSDVVGREVGKLKSDGEMTPMIQDQGGFYIARYISEKPPRNTPFSAVREELRNGYFERWRIQQFLKFTGAMLQHHFIETFAQNLPSYPVGS
jgi:hypothetical protein